MSDTIENAMPWIGPQEDSSRDAAETTSGGTQPTRWVVVADNLNPGEAIVIKGRLESENIPVIVQQEALGAFMGLTVGALGSAKILTPETLAERAIAILEDTFEPDEEPFEEED